MSTGNILKSLRESACMTQAHLAEKVHVTRQAVSRWENGETTPGPDILVSLSMIFGVSVDALLESPEIRYCECCGMPLETGIMGHDKGGNLDPRYCKWCMDQGGIRLHRPGPDAGFPGDPHAAGRAQCR